MNSDTNTGATQASALAGVRVVEYTEMASASFCARLLGDAGADVVKVEAPEGDNYRKHGPFPDGQPDPDWSGMFPVPERQQARRCPGLARPAPENCL